MEDGKIIDLYWQRSQSAIEETDNKYGRQLRGISFNILSDSGDAEECLYDTYMALWNSLPPNRPRRLRAYAAAIVRNLSLKRVRDRCSKKRCCGELELALDELDGCLGSSYSVEREYEFRELAEEISKFLYTLSADDRRIFMCRYWAFAPVAEIAKKLGFPQSKVKSSLYRTRGKLQKYLTKEGLI
ncbi:MAG: sigma-70 family RNA polymerase sigma factor [Candidatus Limivicinus sp.]|nr:sigma-70 family RNA polymerase sigma factor [Candidatus Limivicinus sp.]